MLGCQVSLLVTALAAIGLALVGCAAPGTGSGLSQGPEAETAEVEFNDPLEEVNRSIFGFNQVVDRVVLVPVAKSYRTAMVFLGVGERETRIPTFGGRVKDGQAGLHVIATRGKAVARLTALGVEAAARGLAMATRKPELDAFLVEECTIAMPRRLSYLAVDGEILRLPAPFRYRLARGALKVVAPPPHEEDASG